MKKNILIIVLSSLGICLVIFLLIGFFTRGNTMPMMPPVRISYPKVDEDALYMERIFDTNYVHEVNVKINKSDWEDLKNNSLAKRKYTVDVIIDGIKFSNVSFKTKGNSSLKNIATGPAEGPASSRFSFKIDFGKYEKNQTYFGLDILNLNNIYGDASYLNDYVSYELFRQVGVPAPLASFVYVKINGENLGLYSAVEEIGDSFFERNQLEGLLYKPEQMSGKDRGSSLTYVDEKEENYIDLFNNAESIITDTDKTRLIQSIQKLNQKEDLEKVLDTQEIIRYFVAHNYVLSYDSYTGKSIHNYYLIENNGVLSMIPWDYNLSFGRYNMMEDINTIVNYGIDSPLNRAQSINRPMWNWIEKSDKYREEYHKVMNQLITNFFESGKFDYFVDTTYDLIKPYIPMDISAFYNPTQVETAVNSLKEFCQYRTQSIRLQLDGKLSTITENQITENKVDASNIDLNNLGFIADDTKKQNNNTETHHTDNQDTTHRKKSHSTASEESES